MKRFQIRDKQSGIITHEFEAESIGKNQTEWGVPEREKEESLCSAQEISSRISFRVDPATGITWVKLPATFDVIETDITDEVKDRKRKVFSEKKNAEADIEIATLLGGMEDKTHLMFAVYFLYQAINLDNQFTSQEVAQAKGSLSSYLSLMEQVNAIRQRRDQEIGAYEP